MNNRTLIKIYKTRIETLNNELSKERDEIEIIKLHVEINCYKDFIISLEL